MFQSIRPFIGANDFAVSASFYRDLGFTETKLDAGFSVFRLEGLSFYLQDASVKDWIDNTQVFVEVSDVAAFWKELVARKLTEKYPAARITPPRTMDWGTECFVHDPSGILWHFGSFSNK